VDDVQQAVARIIFREARRAYGYTPADERPERHAEEQADDEGSCGHTQPQGDNNP
jgi:hypothetical protein